MRLGLIFIALCMAVIAASAGATVYLGFGFSGAEAIIVGLSVMTALGLYNALSSRPATRGGLAPGALSPESADFANQMAEFGRRLTVVEGNVAAVQYRARAAIDPLAVEIGELGTWSGSWPIGRDLQIRNRRDRSHSGRFVNATKALDPRDLATTLPPVAAVEAPLPAPPPSRSAGHRRPGRTATHPRRDRHAGSDQQVWPPRTLAAPLAQPQRTASRHHRPLRPHRPPWLTRRPRRSALAATEPATAVADAGRADERLN
jgi:hypothetical protein